MRHAVVRAENAGQQFNGSEDDDEPFGLERDRRENQGQHIIRVEHAESKQQAVNRAGSTHRRDVGKRLRQQHQFMAESRAQPAHEVKNQEFLAAPQAFQKRSEHKERPHVEKDMHEIAMHEHMGHELPPPEERRTDGKQSEQLIHRITDQFGAEKDNDIDDEQVFDGWRQISHNFFSKSSNVRMVKQRRPSGVRLGSRQANSWSTNNCASSACRLPAPLAAADSAILAASR